MPYDKDSPDASATAPALEVFEARASARAMLFAAGDLDLHEAVDPLQVAAIASGLVNEIGQNAVQQILADAFARIQ